MQGTPTIVPSDTRYSLLARSVTALASRDTAWLMPPSGGGCDEACSERDIIIMSVRTTPSMASSSASLTDDDSVSESLTRAEEEGEASVNPFETTTTSTQGLTHPMANGGDNSTTPTTSTKQTTKAAVVGGGDSPVDVSPRNNASSNLTVTATANETALLSTTRPSVQYQIAVSLQQQTALRASLVAASATQVALSAFLAGASPTLGPSKALSASRLVRMSNPCGGAKDGLNADLVSWDRFVWVYTPSSSFGDTLDTSEKISSRAAMGLGTTLAVQLVTGFGTLVGVLVLLLSGNVVEQEATISVGCEEMSAAVPLLLLTQEEDQVSREGEMERRMRRSGQDVIDLPAEETTSNTTKMTASDVTTLSRWRPLRALRLVYGISLTYYLPNVVELSIAGLLTGEDALRGLGTVGLGVELAALAFVFVSFLLVSSAPRSTKEMDEPDDDAVISQSSKMSQRDEGGGGGEQRRRSAEARGGRSSSAADLLGHPPHFTLGAVVCFMPAAGFALHWQLLEGMRCLYRLSSSDHREDLGNHAGKDPVGGVEEPASGRPPPLLASSTASSASSPVATTATTTRWIHSLLPWMDIFIAAVAAGLTNVHVFFVGWRW